MTRKMIARLLCLLLIVCLSVSAALADTLTFPEGVATVEEEAFLGDLSLDTVVLPEGVQAIESRAFADSSVKTIVLPSTLKSIAKDAFSGVSDVQVCVRKNTTAAGLAVSMGLKVRYTGVSLSILIDDFLSMVGAPYASPGATTVSGVLTTGADCSGLFCAAYAHQGFSIYHGSNTVWRNGSLCEKGALNSADQLFPGAAVFRWLESGEPAKYTADGEGNFYHIGLVVSVDPLQIVHSSSTYGVVINTNWRDWQYWGRLTAVDYAGAGSSQIN